MIYLDNNATTRPAADAAAAALDMLREHWHNPSSVHRPGQAARQKIELARESVARLIGATPREIVFTSGATESIDLAVRGVLGASPPSRRAIVTTPIEHEAVRDLCKALGAQREAIATRLLPVSRGGVVDPAALPSLLDDTVALVSVQWANNETGAIQPIDAIARICRDRRIPFHCDGTQWVGKMPADMTSGPPIDLLSCSSHKMHGPKGAGALYLRRGTRLKPVLNGVQELERRGGTENAPGIAGFGIAADLAREWLARPAERIRLAALRDRLEQGVLRRVPDAVVNGPAGPDARLWNTLNIAFPRLEAEALLLLLSEQGLCASAGAACSSGSLDPSPVLLAMGVPAELAHGSLRFSLSRETADAEIDRAIEVIAVCVERLRGSSSAL